MHDVIGNEYSDADLNDMSMEGVCDGVCEVCGDNGTRVEPDAHGYDCDSCGSEGSVSSVFVHLGVI